MHNLFYFFKEAVRGFYQAKLMTFVAIMTIAAALLLMSIIYIVFINVEAVLHKSSLQPDLAVYLKDEAAKNSNTMENLFEKIKAMPEVKRYEFVSKDSAWSRFSNLYGQQMLESVDENPLPSSIDIFLSDKSHSSNVAQTLKEKISSWGEVESVRYSREWMDLIEKFRWYFFTISAILAVVMIPALHFMISNTIKLTIYARKELVWNMHLAGATESFVNLPFILEGMLQGFIGGIVCVLVLYSIRVAVSHLSIVWGPHYLPFLISSVGVLFGWIGSISAVRKFLV